MALPRAAKTQRRTRIQEEKEERILEAALEVFSLHGFRGATVDQIAEVAGMSKPNLLYYFRTKEAMHRALITRVLDTWLDPLREFDAAGQGLAYRAHGRGVQQRRPMLFAKVAIEMYLLYEAHGAFIRSLDSHARAHAVERDSLFPGVHAHGHV